MCTVSMIGDFYGDKWGNSPWNNPHPYKQPPINPPQSFPFLVGTITREEFDALKKEVLDMKELLKRAKEYDEKNNEPHCETESKLALLRKIAEAVGISLDDVLGKPPEPTTA